MGSIPKLNLYIPANVLDFYGFITDIQTFNFISTDKIFIWLKLANDQSDKSNFTLGNTTRNFTLEDET